MDVVLLSRLQFAVATLFHFLFVPLTLGLSILIAVMEAKYVRTGDEKYKAMAKFWGKLFLINFALGVVTGITLEFQFGTNWSRYSEFVGDIFGSLLAIEATLAFFLESTFIAIWFFGWKKLSPKLHNITMWLVAFGVNLSAYWILAANAWMQNPVGYKINPASGRAELTNFFEVVTQEFAVMEFLHTVSGAYVLAGFFVMGVSAYHILKKSHLDFFKESFRIALIFALVFSIMVVGQGHYHASQVAEIQPHKLAAMEAHWDTQKNAPMYVLSIPDPDNEENLVNIIPIPSLLSILAYHSADAEVKGLKDFAPEDRPPVAIVYYSFRVMVGLGFLFILLTMIGWFKRKKLESSPWYLRVMLFSIPLPYLALELGWVVAEVGRQPWIVNGLMRTSDAASPIVTTQVIVTLIAFLFIYGLLGAADFFLLAKYAKKGPDLPDAKVKKKPAKKEAKPASGKGGKK